MLLFTRPLFLHLLMIGMWKTMTGTLTVSGRNKQKYGSRFHSRYVSNLS